MTNNTNDLVLYHVYGKMFEPMYMYNAAMQWKLYSTGIWNAVTATLSTKLAHGLVSVRQ